VAIISAVASVIAAIFSAVLARRHQRQAKEEERRSQAKVVLDRFRGPLLDAANSLGGRIDNIRNLSFLDYLQSDRKRDVKLTTLFRFANYFGWREVVRTLRARLVRSCLGRVGRTHCCVRPPSEPVMWNST
jgi:hypothetical protein